MDTKFCKLAIAALTVILMGCADNTVKQVQFPQVKVPSYINNRHDAVNYLARNYWDNFFKLKTEERVDSLSFDEAFSAYANLLAMADPKLRQSSLHELFINLDSIALKGNRTPLLRVMQGAEHYFYNPVSPYLDEETYLGALDGILAAKSLDTLEKMQYIYQHKICSMNRAGTPAADFIFREQDGYEDKNLYGIKAKYTIIFFNNPDCGACAGILEAIKASPLEKLVNNGDIKVLAMYIDEDLSAWRDNMHKYPDKWIYAHDPNMILRDNNIYGLRAIPSLYLLDKEKRVILKDAPVEKIISYFGSL